MASNFKSYASSAIGTANTAVYTASAVTTVIGFSLANVTEGAIVASIFVTKTGGGGTAYIIKNAPIPFGGSMIAIGAEQKVVLEVGDILYANSSAASSMDTLISTLELS